MRYSRLGMCCLITLESMAQVMLVVHVTLGAQVIVEAHLTLPSHSHDAMLLAAVTDDVGVTHTCRGGKMLNVKTHKIEWGYELNSSSTSAHISAPWYNVCAKSLFHCFNSKINVISGVAFFAIKVRCEWHSKHMSYSYYNG